MSDESERAAFDAWWGDESPVDEIPHGIAWAAWQASAARAQIKPLTDEQIADIWRDKFVLPPAGHPIIESPVYAFARGIERAHGIKGEA